MNTKPKVHTVDLHFMEVDKTIATYVLENDDGLLLIDPGPYTTYTNLQQGLNRRGLSLHDVSDVLITHVHFDHAGAAWALAAHGARVHVHPLGEPHLASPERLWASAARIYSEAGMALLWGAMKPIAAKRLRAWQHEETDLLGRYKVEALHTPGHAKHHIAWRIGNCLFAGDVAGVRIDAGPVEAPCPPPDIDVEAWRASIELISNLRGVDHVYLTHYGEVAGSLQTHYRKLRHNLDALANFVRERLDLDMQELNVELAAHVERMRGKDEAIQGRYSFANPADMSVAGLLRYWKGKLRDGEQ